MTTAQTALIALRIAPALLAKIDAYSAELEATEPGPRWTRSATVRRLVNVGLGSVIAEKRPSTS